MARWACIRWTREHSMASAFPKFTLVSPRWKCRMVCSRSSSCSLIFDRFPQGLENASQAFYFVRGTSEFVLGIVIRRCSYDIGLFIQHYPRRCNPSKVSCEIVYFHTKWPSNRVPVYTSWLLSRLSANFSSLPSRIMDEPLLLLILLWKYPETLPLGCKRLSQVTYPKMIWVDWERLPCVL